MFYLKMKKPEARLCKALKALTVHNQMKRHMFILLLPSSRLSAWCAATLAVSAWRPAPGGSCWRWASAGPRAQMEASPPRGTHTLEVNCVCECVCVHRSCHSFVCMEHTGRSSSRWHDDNNLPSRSKMHGEMWASSLRGDTHGST